MLPLEDTSTRATCSGAAPGRRVVTTTVRKPGSSDVLKVRRTYHAYTNSGFEALLEERLKSARVVTKKEIKSGEVSVGTKVRLRDVKAGKTVEYHIVGSAEADPAENKLSNESPVGKAIMGRKKGETVEVAAPRGKLKFKIMDIKAA